MGVLRRLTTQDKAGTIKTYVKDLEDKKHKFFYYLNLKERKISILKDEVVLDREHIPVEEIEPMNYRDGNIVLRYFSMLYRGRRTLKSVPALVDVKSKKTGRVVRYQWEREYPEGDEMVHVYSSMDKSVSVPVLMYGC